jgi:hypothetical protein
MAEMDLKYLYKGQTLSLSFSQRRLLNAISREPTAHLYSKEYMARYQLTSGGIASGLRTLIKRALADLEDGEWQVQPPEMRKWLKVLHEHGPVPAEEVRWATIDEHSTFIEHLRTAHEENLREEEQIAHNNARRRQGRM